MLGIRHNIFISILLHSLIFAAAFIAGSSSELKVKRLIDVSLVEEWKTGIQGSRSEASFQQQHPKIIPVKVATLKPGSQLITPPDSSGQKATVISTLEAEINPLPTIVSKAAMAANSTSGLSGVPGAELNTSPAASGNGFAAQGMAGGKASTTSDITGSRQQQDSSGDASLRQKIRETIQSNLVYPYIAKKKGIEGVALVAFRINQKGAPEEFRIVRSSGYSILDIAAKETVFKASPFPALNITIEKIPIKFLLKDGR